MAHFFMAWSVRLIQSHCVKESEYFVCFHPNLFVAAGVESHTATRTFTRHKSPRILIHGSPRLGEFLEKGWRHWPGLSFHCVIIFIIVWAGGSQRRRGESELWLFVFKIGVWTDESPAMDDLAIAFMACEKIARFHWIAFFLRNGVGYLGWKDAVTRNQFK